MKKGQRKKGKKRDWVYISCLVAITLAALALRLYRLGYESIWTDEAFTYHRSMKGFFDICASVADSRSPPLYFLVTHFFLKFGSSETYLRAPALLFGVLGVPAMYFLGRELWDKRSGLIAACLLTVSVFHIHYSQEARQYSLFFLLTVLSTLVFLKLLEGRVGWRHSFVYVALTVANMYTHYFAFWVFSAQIISFLAARVWMAEGAWWRRRRQLAWMASVCLGVALCYLPWLRVVLPRMKDTSSETVGPFFSMAFFNQVKLVLAGDKYISLIYLFFFILGCLFLYRMEKLRGLFYLVFSLIYSLAGVHLYLCEHTYFRHRYVIFLLVPFLAVVACGLRWLFNIKGVRRRALLLALAFLPIVLIQAKTMVRFYRHEGFVVAHGKYPWRDVADEFRQGEGRKVIIPAPFYMAKMISYYLRHEQDRFRLANVHMGKERFDLYNRLIEYDNTVDWAGRELEPEGEKVILMRASGLDYYRQLTDEMKQRIEEKDYALARDWRVGAYEFYEYRKKAEGSIW